MPRMVLCLEHRVKVQLRRMRNATADKGLAMRCQIVLRTAKGRSRKEVADGVGCSVSWVDRVLARWRMLGVAGLSDRREDNGQLKLDEAYLGRLYDVVDECPRDYGYPRPTWTTELLAKVMEQQTGVKVHRATMSLALKKIGARLGRPKPTVGCPWPKRRRNRCISAIQKVVWRLRPGEVAVYLDEVDIHLNPKIGAPGQAEAGGDAGAEREAVHRRRVGCAKRTAHLGAKRSQEQPAGDRAAEQTGWRLSEGQSHPRGAGQLQDS